MTQTYQAALAIEGATCAMSIEWDLRGDAAALWPLLPGLADHGVVVGLGAPLLQAAGAVVPGYAALEHLAFGRHTLPATPHALWTLVPGANAGAVFEVAERLKAQLGAHLRIAVATSLFSYRQGRDLTGYQDGTANPKGDEAWAAALIDGGPFDRGSFALVQRWLHFRERFAALPQAERDRTIGRTLDGDVEMADAPPSAHIKRTEQEDYEPPAFMLRRSMPWGDARRHGLVFIAFASDLSKPARMLRRMVGLEDGVADALLAHSQAETGAYYFVPPVAQGRLVLPLRGGVDGVADAAPGRPEGKTRPERATAAANAEPPQHNVICLRENGPLVILGDFTVAGVPQARAALCRCGQSKNKPYCDGSHTAAGFVASGETPALVEAEPQAMPRRVEIQPVADGPLVVHGAVELVAGSGHTISRAAALTLCRCGQSANKPFCDGSHARAGFCAPE